MNIHGGSFSNMQQINHNVARIENTKRSSHQQTLRQLEKIDEKANQATNTVVASAADLNSNAAKVKGNFVDVMA